MALANFFDKAAVAASQVLSGFDNASFKANLEKHLVTVAFDGSATDQAEAWISLELIVNLLSRLYPRIAFVTTDQNGSEIAEKLATLARSINPAINVEKASHDSAVCIAVGMTKPNVGCRTIFVGSDGWIAKTSTAGPVKSGNSGNPFGASAAACIGVANIFRFLFSEQLQGADLDSDLCVSLLEWNPASTPPANPTFEPINIGEIHLVGVGAVGNAAVWALSKAKGLTGTLHLIDHETVESSNFQRYILTDQTHEGKPKVMIAASALDNGALNAVPHQSSWGAYLDQRNDWKLDTVAVAVDSAADRRSIQTALPRRIINAWTQPGDIGISRHSFLGDQACLMCLYLPKGVVKNEDELIAEAIGMPENFLEVRSLLYNGTPLSKEYLAKIATAKKINPALLDPFENKSLRTLYTEGICGGALLELQKGSESQRMEVPLNFQSALAGVMLAAELVVQSSDSFPRLPTATKINILKSLGSHLSLPELKRNGCICGDKDYVEAYRSKYCC